MQVSFGPWYFEAKAQSMDSMLLLIVVNIKACMVSKYTEIKIYTTV